MARTREELRRELQHLGPPEAVEVLMALARDCIFLRRERCDDADIPIGASKIGGAPDLPSDFVWPQGVYDPMAFLAQIDLAEASPLDPTGLLPRSGLLSFFHELDAQLHEFPAEDERLCRVFHVAASAPLCPTAPSVPDALPTIGRSTELNNEQAATGVGPMFRPCRVLPEPLVLPPAGRFANVLESHWHDFDHPDAVQTLAEAYEERPGER